MKLPGIEYGQTQQLGRYDTSAPQREANAKAMVHEANVGVAEVIAKHEAIIYNAESERQFNAANRAYKLSYDKLENEQVPIKKNKETAWTDGSKWFEGMSEESMKAAEESTGMNPLARARFLEQVAEDDVVRRANWDKKAKGWHIKDGRERADVELNEYLATKQWDKARNTIIGNSFFYQQDTYKNLAAVDYSQKYSDFEIRAKTVDVTSKDQVAKTGKLLDDLKNSDMSAKDQNTLNAITKESTAVAFADKAMILSEASFENGGGALKSLQIANDLMTKLWRSDPAEFNNDRNFQHQVVKRVQQVVDHWAKLAQSLKSQNGAQGRLFTTWLSGDISKDYNNDVAEDFASLTLLGAGWTDKGKVGDPDPMATRRWLADQKYPDESGKMVTADERIVSIAERANFVPKVLVKALSGAARNGQKGFDYALRVINGLESTERGRQALHSGGIADADFQKIVEANEIYSDLDSDLRYRYFQADHIVSDKAKNLFWDDYGGRTKWRQDFDKSFQSTLDKKMGTEGGIWGFFSSSINLRARQTNSIRHDAERIQETHPELVIEDCITLAVANFANSNPKSYLGAPKGGVPMHNGVEKYYPQHNLTNEQAAMGYRENARLEYARMNKAREPERQIRELPDEFQYMMVRDIDGLIKMQPYVIEDGVKKSWPPIFPQLRGTVWGKISAREDVRKYNAEQLLAAATREKMVAVSKLDERLKTDQNYTQQMYQQDTQLLDIKYGTHSAFTKLMFDIETSAEKYNGKVFEGTPANNDDTTPVNFEEGLGFYKKFFPKGKPYEGD